MTDYDSWCDARNLESIESMEAAVYAATQQETLDLRGYLESILQTYDLKSLTLHGVLDPDTLDFETYLTAVTRNNRTYPDGEGFPPDGENPSLDALWDVLVDLQEIHRPYARLCPLAVPINAEIEVTKDQPLPNPDLYE